MNITGNHRFVNNAEQQRCKYCKNFIKNGERVICSYCGRSNFTYKRAKA